MAAGPLAFAANAVSGEAYVYQTLAGFPTFSRGCADASGTVAISGAGAAFAAGNDENWRLGRGGLENAQLQAAAWLYGLELDSCQLSDTLSVFTTTSGEVYVGGNDSAVSADMLADPNLGWSPTRNWPKKLDRSFLRENENVVRAFSADGALFVLTTSRLLNLSAGATEIPVAGGAGQTRALVAGKSHFALAAADGRALLGGSNEYGQLCRARSEIKNSGGKELLLPGIDKVTQVAVGDRQTLLLSGGAVYFCGESAMRLVSGGVLEPSVVGRVAERPIPLTGLEALGGAAISAVGIDGELLLLLTEDGNVFGRGARASSGVRDRFLGPSFTLLASGVDVGTFRGFAGPFLVSEAPQTFWEKGLKAVREHSAKTYTLVEQLLIVLVTFSAAGLVCAGALIFAHRATLIRPDRGRRSAKLRRISDLARPVSLQ